MSAQHHAPHVAQLGLTGASPPLGRDPSSVTSILLVTSANVCAIDHLAQDTIERTGSMRPGPATKEWTGTHTRNPMDVH